MISYYGNESNLYRDSCKLYHQGSGGPWSDGYAKALALHRHVLSEYDFVALADDDLDAGSDVWQRLFDVCCRNGLELAHPAITTNAPSREFEPVSGCEMRYSDRSDVICPVFSRDALSKVVESFAFTRTGWGLPIVWKKLLPETKVGIVDSAPVEHTRSFGTGALYKTMSRLSLRVEQMRLQSRYGLL